MIQLTIFMEKNKIILLYMKNILFFCLCIVILIVLITFYYMNVINKIDIKLDELKILILNNNNNKIN